MFITIPDANQDLVLPLSRTASGVIARVISPEPRGFFHDDRAYRQFTLVGDNSRYRISYSTFRSSRLRKGDQVEFLVRQIDGGGSTEDFHYVDGALSVSALTVQVPALYWGPFAGHIVR
jgi:hypothetical protein